MRSCILFGLVLCGAAAIAQAADWTNWRGPTQNGVATGKGYPTSWSKTENTLWSIKLPGLGSSTPAIVGGRIYLTCGVQGKNTALCLDTSGKEIWRNMELGRDVPGKNAKATGSNPSPVVEGDRVYFYFKSGDLACLDLAGKILWQHNLQKDYGRDAHQWDLGTSPVVTKSHVVVAVMHQAPSYLVAFDKESGKFAWKQDRNLGAPAESRDSYSTPLVVQHEGQEQLIVLGGDWCTAHEAATGKELWRVGTLNADGARNFRSIAGPVVADGIVIAPYSRGGTITAIKLGGSGDVTKTHVVWERDDIGSDVPTPTVADGKLYFLVDRGSVACLELSSGKTLWSGRTPAFRDYFSSSPILADGKIYCVREDATTFVIAQGSEFKMLGSGTVAPVEKTVATPVLVDGRIYIRTQEHLHCIGAKST